MTGITSLWGALSRIPGAVWSRLRFPFRSKAVKHDSDFQRKHLEQKRKQKAASILGKSKAKDRIPVICEKAALSELPDLVDKKKFFLAPKTMLLGELKNIVHRAIADQTGKQIENISLFVNDGTSPKLGDEMSAIYKKHKAADDFLYLAYDVAPAPREPVFAKLREYAPPSPCDDD